MNEKLFSRRYHQKKCVLCGDGFVSVVGAAKYCPYCREQIRPTSLASVSRGVKSRKGPVARTSRSL